MKTVLQFSFLLLGSIALAGCSYFDAGPSTDNAQTVDMTAKQIPPVPPVEDLISTLTDGSVEVFPLDGAAVSTPDLQPLSSGNPDEAFSYGDSDAIPVETVAAVPVGRNFPKVYSGDPSVQVFSLDGPPPSAAQSAPQNYNVVNASTGAPAVVYFEHGSATLDAEDDSVIDMLVANNNMARGISVEGFASVQSTIDDPVKRKVANLQMSMKRAIAVSRALIEKGVSGELLTTVAHGENQPAATPDQSRRVEIRGL